MAAEETTHYIVVEMQDGNVNDHWWNYDNKPDAEVKYHQVIAEAVKSQIEKHLIMLQTDEGYVIEHKYYYHKPEEPAPALTDGATEGA